MEFKDVHDKVYSTFQHEFLYFYNKDVDSDKSWRDFIKDKDLGIQYILKPRVDVYEIIDVKKWILTRLKYGI